MNSKKFLSFVGDLNRTLQQSQRDMQDVQTKSQHFSEQCQHLKLQVEKLEREKGEMEVRHTVFYSLPPPFPSPSLHSFALRSKKTREVREEATK